MLRHILWDWNGTLLNDTAECVLTLNGTLRKHGMVEVTEEQYREVFRFPVRDYYVDLGFDFDRYDWDETTADFFVRYMENARESPLREGAVDALERLGERGMPMSILSAASMEMLESMVTARNIGHHFQKLYGLSTMYADSKLAVGRKAVAEIGGAPNEILLVGDTKHDYEVACELGCCCVLLSGGHQSDLRLKSYGCDILYEMGDVVNYVERTGR